MGFFFLGEKGLTLKNPMILFWENDLKKMNFIFENIFL